MQVGVDTTKTCHNEREKPQLSIIGMMDVAYKSI